MWLFSVKPESSTLSTDLASSFSSFYDSDVLTGPNILANISPWSPNTSVSRPIFWFVTIDISRSVPASRFITREVGDVKRNDANENAPTGDVDKQL